MDDLFVKPLPTSLLNRYKGWKATQFEENKVWYKRLADEGQKPRAMIISCCDSRVHATSIFGADMGEFFIHRNIANLVPPCSLEGDKNGTSAAIEYAVTALKVAHIVILGHSNCGGVQGCFNMCTGKAPELEKSTSFVGRWIDTLRPGFERLGSSGSDEEKILLLEKEGIAISLENLRTFPFVAQAMENGNLSIHGLWHDIANGVLFALEGGSFKPLVIE